MSKIFVTKSFLPPLEEYIPFLEKIWESGVLTNQGPCLVELEGKLKTFLEAEHLHYLCNGTVALQLALAALDIQSGEIITTPFSYVATTSSILWEKCSPIFVDIEKENFTIDYTKIEEAITPKTRAIMAVHVFGYACNVEKIQEIACKHNLHVIYDGAHAFGTKYKGKSLFSYGDITTLSLHATKLFHTVEGGVCICNSEKVSAKLDLQKRFGQRGNDQLCLGINAKQSEFHAAMGLACFPYLDHILLERKRIASLYNEKLSTYVQLPKEQKDLEHNYAYYPVVFKDENELMEVFAALEQEQIYPRRYFYPSLNTLNYVKGQPCPISEDVTCRIACLPIFPGLQNDDVTKISHIITSVLLKK